MSDRELWEEFGRRLEALGGRVVTLAEALEFAADKACWRDPDCMVPGLPEGLASSPWEAKVGFTLGDLAVAETGSIVLSAGPGRARLASLASVHHIALVPCSSIVATMEEAFGRLSPRTSVIITGPSRTADIEGVLVRGIHGPRELWVVPKGLVKGT
ncbi:MAG: LUD domain-containing protein [Fimbriimonadaceae bacterium]|nr:LUD domain-containing protein [Fimbriimonadaceae bacterium]